MAFGAGIEVHLDLPSLADDITIKRNNAVPVALNPREPIPFRVPDIGEWVVEGGERPRGLEYHFPGSDPVFSGTQRRLFERGLWLLSEQPLPIARRLFAWHINRIRLQIGPDRDAVVVCGWHVPHGYPRGEREFDFAHRRAVPDSRNFGNEGGRSILGETRQDSERVEERCDCAREGTIFSLSHFAIPPSKGDTSPVRFQIKELILLPYGPGSEASRPIEPPASGAAVANSAPHRSRHSAPLGSPECACHRAKLRMEMRGDLGQPTETTAVTKTALTPPRHP